MKKKLLLFIISFLILSVQLAEAHASVYESTWNGAMQSGWDYFILGVKHIIPLGTDHLLFMLGLLLTSRNLKSVLLLATAFTVAHTITLILTSLGKLPSDPGIIEPIISLSIAAIGIENILNRGIKPTSYFLTFAFGLIHGCGFASALSESGIPENFFFTSLISFNLGIEAAQIGFILVLFFFFNLVKNESYYRKLIVIPLSILIIIAGISWTYDRISNNAQSGISHLIVQ
jgi:hypothetical protein